MSNESKHMGKPQAKLVVKRGRKALIGTKLRIGPQPRPREPEAWVEPVMVRAALMNRTWSDWGFRNGTAGSGPRLLLKALHSRAAGIALDELEREGCGSKTVARLSAQIHRLIAHTNLSEARLADELDHDIKRWEWHWETLRHYSINKAGRASTDEPAPLRRAPGGGLVRSRYTINPNVETPDGGGNSNMRTATLAPLSRATAGPAGQGPAAATYLAIPNKPGGGRIKMTKAVEAMVAAVNSGQTTFAALRRMKQKELESLYPSAKRTLLAKARNVALSKLATMGYSDGTAT